MYKSVFAKAVSVAGHDMIYIHCVFFMSLFPIILRLRILRVLVNKTALVFHENNKLDFVKKEMKNAAKQEEQ